MAMVVESGRLRHPLQPTAFWSAVARTESFTMPKLIVVVE
jgi:hypothetical protein